MALGRAAAAVEVQPIDRLEEKVRQMVAVIDALRAEKAKAVDDAARLQQEVSALKARLAEGANASAELATMREERDLIRARVTQMISQIDRLNL
jgi:regulator of replication initiation timing